MGVKSSNMTVNYAFLRSKSAYMDVKSAYMGAYKKTKQSTMLIWT